MKPPSDETAYKLGANRTEPARKSRRAKNFSESTDVHEDRGTVQSKFAHVESTTANIRTLPHASGPRSRAATGPASFPATKPGPQHAAGPQMHPVRLHFFRQGAQHVCVAGTFNGWAPEKTPLEKNGVGEWEITLSLAPGDYEYRFVADGEWMDDPLACRHAPNPFGGQNAVLHVHHD
jgi:hypothetical protein